MVQSVLTTFEVFFNMQNAEFWAVHLSDCFLICIRVEADALSSTDAGP
jgi:hypothetical protein